MTISVEDNFIGRRTQWKTTLMEDGLNGTQPQWNTTLIEDDVIASANSQNDNPAGGRC